MKIISYSKQELALLYFIIRKTKCSRIFKRSASFSKTKCNFSKLSPYPKNLKKIDRLRRNFIHLKAVRTHTRHRQPHTRRSTHDKPHGLQLCLSNTHHYNMYLMNRSHYPLVPHPCICHDIRLLPSFRC